MSQRSMSSDETVLRAAIPPATPILPGIALGPVLGRGGMATVYEGLDQGFSPPRRVAVKLMNTDISADPDFRARFEHEASVVADFRHDNIVRVYASGETRGTKYIVMEYLPGGTLADRLEHGGTLLPNEVMRTGAQLADALAYAHGRGVVHRDFKPGNVLFTSEDKPVLSDFGVAKSIRSGDAQLTRHASVIGAPRYMAPEQERGEAVSDRADIYSLGLTLYEMLTGVQPITRERVLQSADAGLDIRQKLAPLAPSLADLICRCLMLDPDRRPTASQCAQQLSASSAETMSRGSARISREPMGRTRRVIAGSVLTTALLLVLGAAVYGLRPRSAAPGHAENPPPAQAPVLAPSPSKVPAPPANFGLTEGSAGVVSQPGTSSAFELTCGPGDPNTLLGAAVTNGLRAKVELTLASGHEAQREAVTTLQRQVACLESLADAGVKSDDSVRLQQDAKALLEAQKD
jgi:serine/threonine protein kinase